MAEDQDATTIVGFTQGTRARPQGPDESARPPSPDAEAPEEEPRSKAAPEEPPMRLSDRLRQQVDQLRGMAAGSGRPLASPEGRGEQPRPTKSRSSASSNDARRLVDATALGVRNASKLLDWVASRWVDWDFVTTAEESYGIASPLAGVILDRVPETGPLAELPERAGIIGTLIAIGTWLGRAIFGKPGGREEAAALQEELVERMVRERARRRRRQEEAPGEGRSEPDGGGGPVPPSAPWSPNLSTMLGLPGEPGLAP